RLVVVAEPQPDLADLVVGEADGVEHVEALELAARLHRLALRLLPGAVQALQLGPVHAALAAVSLDRAHPHPAVGLVDPLAGATVLAEVREGRDRQAVDVAGVPGVGPLRGRRGRPLLDPRQALAPPALPE